MGISWGQMNERKRERGSEEECATQLVPLKRGSPEEVPRQAPASLPASVFLFLKRYNIK